MYGVCTEILPVYVLSGTKLRVLHNLADKRIRTDLYAQGALVRKKKLIIFIFYSNWPK